MPLLPCLLRALRCWLLGVLVCAAADGPSCGVWAPYEQAKERPKMGKKSRRKTKATESDPVAEAFPGVERTADNRKLLEADPKYIERLK